MKYEVVLQRTVQVTATVEAPNPYQAALLLAEPGDEVLDVTQAGPGRPRNPTTLPATKAVKKRKPLSPEARARLAQNLVKARAARAAKAKARKRAAKKAA